MFSLNRAQIVGNLTRDPEMRYTPNGQSVSSFGVATNRRWRDKDGNQQEATEFHNIVAWGKLAEIVSQILHKGNKVYIEGRIQTSMWEGQDGAKRNRTEIVAENFISLTPKGTSEAMPEMESTSKEETPSIEKAPTDTENKPKKTTKKETPDKDTKNQEEDEIDLDEIPF